MDELKARNIDSIVAATGAELMALAVYQMSDYGEKNRDDLVKAMGDVLAQNVLSLKAFDITTEELAEAFRNRMHEVEKMVVGEKNDEESGEVQE